MPRLYRNESSYAKVNAQKNLCGRTHYVDDNTLRGFYSRVISARAIDGGLLFAIVTSDAQDYKNTRRGFRYVVFDLFGTVLDRNPKSVEDKFFRTSAQAEKAMWEAVNALDAVAITNAAIVQAQKHFEDEMQYLRTEINSLIDQNKVKVA